MTTAGHFATDAIKETGTQNTGRGDGVADPRKTKPVVTKVKNGVVLEFGPGDAEAVISL